MYKAKFITANGTVESFLRTVVITIIIKAVLIKIAFLVVKTLLFLIILKKPYNIYIQLTI